MTEKVKSPAGNRKADTFMPPDKTGSIKRHPLHMSVDELTEYRKTGVVPPVIIQPGQIKELAENGNSISTICSLFKISRETFHKNSAFLTEFYEGRGQVARLIRQQLVDQALHENSIQAMIYLDKILGGDAETVNINATVTARPLEDVKTEDLIEIAFKDKKDD